MEHSTYKKLDDALSSILLKDLDYCILKHEFKKGESVRRHYHPKATEWLIIDNGKFEVRVDDERQVYSPKNEVMVLKFLVAQKHAFTALSDISYLVIRDRQDETIFSNRLF